MGKVVIENEAHWHAMMAACRQRFLSDARLRRIYGITDEDRPGDEKFEAMCGKFCSTAAAMGFQGVDLSGDPEVAAEARVRARFKNDRAFRALMGTVSNDPRSAEYQRALSRAIMAERKDARDAAELAQKKRGA